MTNLISANQMRWFQYLITVINVTFHWEQLGTFSCSFIEGLDNLVWHQQKLSFNKFACHWINYISFGTLLLHLALIHLFFITKIFIFCYLLFECFYTDVVYFSLYRHLPLPEWRYVSPRRDATSSATCECPIGYAGVLCEMGKPPY